MAAKADSREAVKGLLRGMVPARPLFLPLVFRMGARIENLPLRSFLSNPTKICNALRQIRTQLRADAVTCYLDPLLELEAFGAVLDWNSEAGPTARRAVDRTGGELPRGLPSPDEMPARGRVPVAIEVIRRLKSLLRDDCLLLAGIRGPFTLGAELIEAGWSTTPDAQTSDIAMEAAAASGTKIATAFLEAGANVIVIREEQTPGPEDGSTPWASALETTINVVRFYGALPVLILGGAPAHGGDVLSRPWECVVCVESSEDGGLADRAAGKLPVARRGLAVPASTFRPNAASAMDFCRKARQLAVEFRPGIITTSDDVPVDADLRTLNNFRDTVIG
jgi:hypothetical protein